MSSMKRNNFVPNRPRSPSGIPIAANRQSRSSIRNSDQGRRTNSMCRPTQEKRSLDRNLVRSKSNVNLSNLPRLSRQRSGSLLRQTRMLTPLGAGGSQSRKSPMSSVRKEERPINDRQWQLDEMVKIRNFVASHMCHLAADVDRIKSGISLELFVALMHSYFQMIDKRITITRANYIEEVPACLKRYRYTVNVKASLMKTVNTPHSWPHVVAILSWLTDIVTELQSPPVALPPLQALVHSCAMEMFVKWNQGQEDDGAPLSQLAAKLAETSGVSDDKIKALSAELETLHVEVDTYAQRINEKKKQNEALRKRNEMVREKCNSYIAQNQDYEKKVRDKQQEIRDKIKNIDQQLPELLRTEEHLKSVVASQSHSRAEMQQLTVKIEALKNTIKLQEERMKQHEELVRTYDFKLSDIKQKVEASAYKYNNVLSQLEISNPELKNLHVRERGFARSDTEGELEQVKTLLADTITKLKEDLIIINTNIEESDQKDKQCDKKLLAVKSEVAQLATLDAELKLSLAHSLKQYKLEIEQMMPEITSLQNKLTQLKNSRPDVTVLEKEAEQLRNKKEEIQAFNKDVKKRGLKFFITLEGYMQKNLENYMKVIEDLNAGMAEAYKKAIKNTQTRLDELRKARGEAEK